MALKLKSKDQLIAEYAKSWKGWKVNGKGVLVRTKKIDDPWKEALHTKGVDSFDIKGYDPKTKLFIRGVANANEVDRMNEVLDPTGIQADSYMKNPVMLLQHNHSAPIGLTTMLKPESTGILTEGWVGDPAAAPLTGDQEKARSLVIQKILRAFSVGFIPHEIRMPTYNDQGMQVDPAKILIWEILENSIVAVPCNAGSLFETVKQPEKDAKPKTRKVYLFPSMGKDGRLQIHAPQKSAIKSHSEAKNMELDEILKQQLTALNGLAEGIKGLAKGQETMLEGFKGIADHIKGKKPKKEDDECDDDEMKAIKAQLKTAVDANAALTKEVGDLKETIKSINDSMGLMLKHVGLDKAA